MYEKLIKPPGSTMKITNINRRPALSMQSQLHIEGELVRRRKGSGVHKAASEQRRNASHSDRGLILGHENVCRGRGGGGVCGSDSSDDSEVDSNGRTGSWSMESNSFRNRCLCARRVGSAGERVRASPTTHLMHSSGAQLCDTVIIETLGQTPSGTQA
eukprot:6179182-Pleurochrysis_carterae.AAC.3